MLGNDVVDLADPEARAAALHPRFDRRVLDEEEQAWLRTSQRPERDRWVLWAAKESAFKAARRLDAGVVFSPVRFAVRLRAEAGAFRGSVHHRGRRFCVSVEVERDLVHAVCRAEPWVGSEPLCAVETVRAELAPSEASARVREMARSAVAAALDLAPAALRFDRSDRLPLLRAGDRVVSALSLSHHGRSAAFAAALP